MHQDSGKHTQIEITPKHQTPNTDKNTLTYIQIHKQNHRQTNALHAKMSS